MFHYLYKITNLINNKYYIGVHSTDNIDDGYLGSGLALKNAIKKYGKENFKKEILEYFDDAEHMYQKEAEIVNESLINDPNCYNITLGGYGFHKDYKICIDCNNIIAIVHKNDSRLQTGELCIAIPVKDDKGNTLFIRKDDPNYGKKYVPIPTGMVNVKTRTGISTQIPKEEFYKNRNKYVFHLENKFTAKDKNGSTFIVSKNDERIKKGELFGCAKGLVPAKDNNGHCISITKEEYKTGKYKHRTSGRVVVKDKNGRSLSVSVNDPRYLSGELVRYTTNMVTAKNEKNEIIYVTKEEFKLKKLQGNLKNTMGVYDQNNVRHNVNADDPKFLSGEYKMKFYFKDSQGKYYTLFLDDPIIQKKQLKFCTSNNKKKIEKLKKYNLYDLYF